MGKVYFTHQEYQNWKHQIRKMRLPDHIVLDWYKNIYKPDSEYMSTVHAEVNPKDFEKMSHDLVWIGSSVGDIVTPRTGVVVL